MTTSTAKYNFKKSIAFKSEMNHSEVRSMFRSNKSLVKQWGTSFTKENKSTLIFDVNTLSYKGLVSVSQEAIGTFYVRFMSKLGKKLLVVDNVSKEDLVELIHVIVIKQF
jgi:hypothetical protein